MVDGDWARDVDVNLASTGRMYDYYLGGHHNFPCDREAAERVAQVVPNIREIARANRAFVARAVTHLVHLGVEQFLDIGSGIPTAGNVHDIAQQHNPDARIVYVDTDAVAIAHSIELLRDNPHATAIRADLRSPDAILQHHGVRSTLDLTRPVGLLLVSVLQFVPDADAYPAVAALRAALPTGSYLTVSHVAAEATDRAAAAGVAAVYRRTDAPTTTTRTREQIHAFFDGCTLLDPGLVWVTQWPTPTEDDTPEHIPILAAIGRTTG